MKQSLFDGVLNPVNDIDFVDFITKGRSQFIQQLEEFINQTEQSKKVTTAQEMDEPHLQPPLPFDEENLPVDELDFAGDDAETHEQPAAEPAEKSVQTPASQTEELEKVMNNGLLFLAGLMKMTTGQDIGIESQKIEINKETGEVTMKFKLPV